MTFETPGFSESPQNIDKDHDLTAPAAFYSDNVENTTEPDAENKQPKRESTVPTQIQKHHKLVRPLIIDREKVTILKLVYLDHTYAYSHVLQGTRISHARTNKQV